MTTVLRLDCREKALVRSRVKETGPSRPSNNSCRSLFTSLSGLECNYFQLALFQLAHLLHLCLSLFQIFSICMMLQRMQENVISTAPFRLIHIVSYLEHQPNSKITICTGIVMNWWLYSMSVILFEMRCLKDGKNFVKLKLWIVWSLGNGRCSSQRCCCNQVLYNQWAKCVL